MATRFDRMRDRAQRFAYAVEGRKGNRDYAAGEKIG